VHRNTVWNDANLESNPGALEFVNESLPKAFEILPAKNDTNGNRISDHFGETLGAVLQTSPQSDHVIGYSGPTNCLVLLDSNNRILSVGIAESGDTVDHIEAVKRDSRFLKSFSGIGFGETEKWKQIDAVSGATLSSYSVIAAVANRMGGQAQSLKFDPEPDMNKVYDLIAYPQRLEPTDQPGVWDVYSETEKIGSLLSTSPRADHLSGYQGPTKTLAAFGVDGKCVGLIVDHTYENQPYASYLDDDQSFQKIYRGKTIAEIAELVPQENGIDGVSGATMTSVCVAEALSLAAKKAIEKPKPVSAFAKFSNRSSLSWWADILTVLLTVIGICLSFLRDGKHKSFRIAYQVAVILFLGFVNGHMLSQASIVGWSKSAVPWTVAPGLVFLSLAALAVPIFSKRQPYCHHICPFGAVQQLAIKRIAWKFKIPKWLDRVLGLLPFALLSLVVYVAMSKTNFNLASIEPFDGFAFRVAGWATISVFLIGVIASLFSPMAYCRYGCPTGALLGFLRFRGDSDRIGTRDWAAMALLTLAIFLWST
jgi:Na+-translocating ferredoxin:NAD+ oxidoreductase RnfG subunit